MRLGDLDALKVVLFIKFGNQLPNGLLEQIDNFPTVRLHSQWIPIKYRPITNEERKEIAEHYGIENCDTIEEKTFDCPMPEDGQRILLSRSWGVDIDVADNDIDGEGFICYGLEGNGDWDGVIAWMPLPEPYKKEGDKE